MPHDDHHDHHDPASRNRPDPKDDEQAMPRSESLLSGWRRKAARILYSQASAGASDYARALVPVIAEDDMPSGSYIRQARHLRAWALEVMTAAVLVERARGASWQQVAAAFGYDQEMVKARWEPVEQAWQENRSIELDGIRIASMVEWPTTEAEADKAAAVLDAWCNKPHLAPADASNRRAVSGGL